MKSFLVGLAICLYGVALPAFAQVYRCVVDDEVTISTDPCPAGAKVTEFKPEPGAAEREAAAKKAADENLAHMKERIEVMERERLEREAALDEARREEELKAMQSDPEPVQVPGGTVLYRNRYPNQYPGYRPDTGRPRAPASGERPGKDPKKKSGIAIQNSGSNQNGNTEWTLRLTSEPKAATKPKAASGAGRKK